MAYEVITELGQRRQAAVRLVGLCADINPPLLSLRANSMAFPVS